MKRARKSQTSPRKQPVQARSAQLVADILQAAIRVLEKEGASRFTTIRVAEAAGVSVGSLYQYFPNKQAILYRLQLDEWERTGRMIETLLGDESKTPRERLVAMTHAFFVSECEEAPLRRALDAAAPSYHAAEESQAHRDRSRAIVGKLVVDAAPNVTTRQRKLATDLVLMTITALGKEISERDPSPSDLRHWADSVADMVWGHLRSLDAR